MSQQNEMLSPWGRSKVRLCVSFSGGKTSGCMARRLLTEGIGENVFYRDQYQMVFVFANTGCENEETLAFVNYCDKEWGLNLAWLEAVVHPGEKRGCTHKIVTYETASRNGEPFEAVIQKYGIPNKAYPHCTRELKLNPIRSYLASIGWETGHYFSAVGIRSDEPRRIRKAAELIYPLADPAWFPMTKPEVNAWWEQQPFNLELADYRGNCKWCWKKSTTKLVQIAKETPGAFDFPGRMEREYPLAGHNIDGTPRTFFRQHMSTKHILWLAGEGQVPPIRVDADADSGCSESCDAFLFDDSTLQKGDSTV